MKEDNCNMKVLVTGANGQLGYDVLRVLKEHNIDYLGTDIDQLDITIENDVYDYVKKYQPSVIIHCAAYTAVDKAEENQELCYKINVLGTRYLVKAAQAIDAKFVYISTDYVFNGEGETPFTINDKPEPVNYYGKTKYLGELEVLNNLSKSYIIRISWVFGINGHNFIKTMLKLSETRDTLTVVSDQIGSPTYTFDLAYAIYDLINSDTYGIHHITNEGYCSWNEFSKEIFRQSNKDIAVNEILTKDYPTAAKRPLNSRMEKNSITLRPWQEALDHFLKEYNHD